VDGGEVPLRRRPDRPHQVRAWVPGGVRLARDLCYTRVAS
jgi:hypothetical protein